jgi:hypothetical protein
MSDGTVQQPGGWNRFAIEIDDLPATVEKLRAAGVHFRGDMVTGIGGKHIPADEPSGNPDDLYEPLRPAAPHAQR